MGKKKFEKLLLKNTLAIALPAMVVFLVLTILFAKHPLFEQVKCVTIADTVNYDTDITKLYLDNTTNVEITVTDLYYSGFDYFVDGEIAGAYYYTTTTDKMSIFLIKTTKPEEYIDKAVIKGKIIRNDISAEHIINRFAEDNDMDVELLKGYCFDYIISEPDYPHAYIAMLYVFFLTPILVCVLIFVYTLVIWYNPSLHAQCKQLEKYGNIHAIIEELNLQLKNQLLFKKNNIYITRDYMVVNYFIRTDVIKLDFIKYLSKNIVEKKEFPHRISEVYRLTMSNPDVIFYEVDFVEEELIDDVVSYIRGVNKQEKKA
ncbi:MAG: hypothetical protein E7258_03785 [Lachnospiraceae bacterium]|nr:hypothetical protein [Lachnospiraceae bacterium]